MSGDDGRPVLRVIDGGQEPAASSDAIHTVADVAEACGLPQPVIAQVVPRTWTELGWMYTDAQLEEAVEIAAVMRSGQGGG